jgi:hypothetical protein
MTKKMSHDPKHWYDHAEDARKLAAQILDPISRRTMLGIAESYESLARRAKKQLQQQKNQNKHWPDQDPTCLNQKDRLAAVSPKSDQVF